MQKLWTLIVLLVFVPIVSAAEPWPGAVKKWEGFDKHEFKFEGRTAFVIEPSKAAAGSPWMWRARFPGVATNDDLELVKQGWHIAYVDTGNMYGNDASMVVWDHFYDELTTKHGLSKKPVLKGLSRGGLFIINWGARHPDRVLAIYGDAPVCDLKSWPGGKGKGKGSPADWQRAIAAYGMKSEQEMLDYKQQPFDRLEGLAKAHVPILIVAGDSDTVVPFIENGEIVQKRYQELGGSIKVILKPGGDHHPHGLTDPKPLVDFELFALKYNNGECDCDF
ncbi:MAG: alpha/beta hydrolase [Planctomycetes bacterium]|nr:alpha/beta hydrolase [Planctomycetota bacterium]